MSFLSSLTLLPVLFLASILDARDGRIPNELIVLGFALSGLTHLLEHSFGLPSLPAVLLILILMLLRRFHLIGGGDIKLFLLILFLLPSSGAAILIFTAFLINALFGLVLLISCRIRSFPLGPGIYASAVVLHLFGQAL